MGIDKAPLIGAADTDVTPVKKRTIFDNSIIHVLIHPVVDEKKRFIQTKVITDSTLQLTEIVVRCRGQYGSFFQEYRRRI